MPGCDPEEEADGSGVAGSCVVVSPVNDLVAQTGDVTGGEGLGVKGDKQVASYAEVAEEEVEALATGTDDEGPAGGLEREVGATPDEVESEIADEAGFEGAMHEDWRDCLDLEGSSMTASAHAENPAELPCQEG